MTAATTGRAAHKVRAALAEAVGHAMQSAHTCTAQGRCEGCESNHEAAMNLADMYADTAQDARPAPMAALSLAEVIADHDALRTERDEILLRAAGYLDLVDKATRAMLNRGRRAEVQLARDIRERAGLPS